MGNADEDFINSFIYDLPDQKRFRGAEVVKYKQVHQIGDDWGANVAGTWLALVYKNNKPYAVIIHKLTIDDRYDKNDEQKDYNDFTDAVSFKSMKVKLIKSIPNVLK